MISFAMSKRQIFEQNTTSQASIFEMNAFRNILAYFDATNPSSEALEERSSAPRDGGDGLSSHQGE